MTEHSGFKFSKSNRLLKPAQFQAIFDKPDFKAFHPQLLLLARQNDDLPARLGLVIGKKKVRLAVDRNRIKRIIRESFRHCPELNNIDVIAIARSDIHKLDNQTLRQLVDKQWRKLLSKKQK